MKKLFLGILAVSVLFLIGCRGKRPPNEVDSLEDIPGKIIGALYGTPSARLAAELGTAKIFYNGEEMIHGLITGTVDCAVMENIVANELITGISEVRLLNEKLLEYELRFAVPRENAELLRVVNSALSALNSNGTLRGLRDKYFSGKNFTYTPPENITKRPGKLKFATLADAPPYSFKDDKNEFSGLSNDVTRAVCDYLGVELEIIEVDEKDLVTAVWFGWAELSAGWLPGDIDEQVSISDPYATIAQVVIVRR